MKLYNISDISIKSIRQNQYDLAIFTSGYEKRSTFIATLTEKMTITDTIVFGFKEYRDVANRKINDNYFTKTWKKEPLLCSTDRDEMILQMLTNRLAKKNTKLRILVDYSSMSKLWYAAILNWARYSSRDSAVQIDFLYSIGDHKQEVLPLVIHDAPSIPGCEGKPRLLDQLVAILGLGFDGYAALNMVEHLEPDHLYNYIAAPAAFRDYPARAKRINRELIKRAGSGHLLELPLNSVAQTFSYLSELVIPFLNKFNVTIVPMGPKPHALATILLAMRFPEITCLRLSGTRRKLDQVGTTEDLVATSVLFRADEVKIEKISNLSLAVR